MRNILKIIIIIVFLLFIACGVYAAELITQDPNVKDNTEKQEIDNQDLHLAVIVNYQAKRKTVSAILEDLSNIYGVKFYAGYNKNDWQVRDRKMNIFAKDITLAQLMSSIAHVMKFKWSINKEKDVWTYRLYMDRRTLLDAEAQRTREQEKIEQEMAKKREDALSSYGKIANLSEQDIEKLKAENPYMYEIAKSGVIKPFASFMGQSPMAVDALANGQSFSFSGSSMSNSGLQSLYQSIQALNQLWSPLGTPGSTNVENLLNSPNSVTVSVNPDMEMMRINPNANSMLGLISIKYDGGFAFVPIMDPESQSAKMFGQLMMRCENEGKKIYELPGDETMAAFNDAVSTDMKKEDVGEKQVEQPDEPALHVKIKLKQESTKIADIEQAIAGASGMSIVSDSFDNGFGMFRFDSKEAELKDVLKKFCDSYRYNWQKSAAVIELRDREWYKKRASQIPEAWLDEWRNTFKKTKTLDIDDLAQIAMLTQEQFVYNVVPDETLAMVQPTIFMGRDILRLYAILSESQRTMLFTESGLDFGSLNQDQLSYAQKTIGKRRPDLFLSQDAKITISAIKYPNTEKSFHYGFQVASDQNSDTLKMDVFTPVYIEQPEKKTQTGEEAKPAK